MSSEAQTPDAAPQQPGPEQKSYPADLQVPVMFALNEIPTVLRIAQVASQAANLELGAASAVIAERVRLAQSAAAAAFDVARNMPKSGKRGK